MIPLAQFRRIDCEFFSPALLREIHEIFINRPIVAALQFLPRKPVAITGKLHISS